jgi:hypothetical protein
VPLGYDVLDKKLVINLERFTSALAGRRASLVVGAVG